MPCGPARQAGDANVGGDHQPGHYRRLAYPASQYRHETPDAAEYLAPEDLQIAFVLEDYAALLELMGRAEEAHANEHRAKQIREFHSPLRID